MKSRFVSLGLFAATGVVIAGVRPADAPKPVAKAPTYATDIAPLLNAKCVSCHRPGEVAPFSLIGYDNAKKWSRMAAHVTQKRIMPPWKASSGYGEFQFENRLSEAEIATLAAWDKAGAPRGDKRKEPVPPKFNSEWTLGEPDLVLSPAKAFKLDAEGPDVYRNFVIKNDRTEPMWVKAIDVRPGNKSIVHHVIAYLDRTGEGTKLESQMNDGQLGYTSDGGGVGFFPTGSLGGWAPGLRPVVAPEGVAYCVQPGTSIVMQVHYHKSGKAETDQTRLGLYLAKEPITRELKLHWIFNFNLNIPPGEKAHGMRRVFTYAQDETIYAVMPHMHLLGRKMKSWLELPDGTTKPLVNVEDWDFNWQLMYAFRQPIQVPAGTKQIVEAVYDNSTDNPNNPNTPPKRVTFGEATTDEMFLMITSYTVERK